MKNIFRKRWLLPLLLVAVMSCLTLTSCSNDDEPQSKDPSELIVGKWLCYNDAYGDPWNEPLEFRFDSDGTGYGWFQEEPFSYSWEFTYTITESKIRFKENGRTSNVRYEISSNGKTLVLYGYDDNDMEELHFVKQ